MATVAPPAPPAPRKSKDSTSGGGGSGILDRHFGGGGGDFIHQSFPLSRYRTGIWVALAPIVMLFASLTSAYIVRQGLGEDWRPTTLPSVLWWNSLVLVASSITMEMARRKSKPVSGLRSRVSGSGWKVEVPSQVAGRKSQAWPESQGAGRKPQVLTESKVEGCRSQAWPESQVGIQSQVSGHKSQVEDLSARHGSLPELRKWLLITLLLGLGFLLGQIVAWRQLAARGIYLATNPSSSFFYLLTATHGLHLLGGIAGLACVVAATWKKLTPGGRTGVGVAAIYWHFMDGLWIYVLLLLLLVP